MAVLKQGDGKENEHDDSWEKWKRGGLIGAAAITGGTLMAITGGLAAPAIASGVSALAPTLGTIVPVVGAGGFVAVASATGSIAGSVAVAASFGGAKMARRTGSVGEVEFKVIGENHNNGAQNREFAGTFNLRITKCHKQIEAAIAKYREIEENVNEELKFYVTLQDAITNVKQ